MKVYYRLSNLSAGGNKIKLPHATKQHCLENCIKEFGLENITVLGDKLNQKTLDYVNSLDIKLVQVNNGTGSGTFRDALNLAIKENQPTDLVYLLEDDFLHKPGSLKLLTEALNTWDCYVTLYDCPDKYMDPKYGGNPQIEGGGEYTKVFLTQSIHWKITNSTVMSFACSVKRLQQDKDLLYKYSSGRITQSYELFTELRDTKGISVISSIPGFSTHCESRWLTPLTDWAII